MSTVLEEEDEVEPAFDGDDDLCVGYELTSSWTLDAAGGPEELSSDREMVRDVDHVLRAISPRRALAIRRLFCLTPWEDCEEDPTFKAVGETLGIGRGGANNLIHGGLHLIRWKLELKRRLIDHWIPARDPANQMPEPPPTRPPLPRLEDVPRRCATGCWPSLPAVAEAILKVPMPTGVPCATCGQWTPFAHPYLARPEPARRYLAVIFAAGTCDRSIGCGIATIGIRATTWETAEKEFTDGFLKMDPRAAVGDGYKHVFLYEFTGAREINVRELVKKIVEDAKSTSEPKDPIL